MNDEEIENKKLCFCHYFDFIFFHAAAIYCFFLSISYWVRIIGLYDGSLWRIDLMPGHLQIYAVIFAVLYPIAFCGLWQETRWGKLLWGASILINLFFLLSNNDYFPSTLPITIINFILVIIYCIKRFIICKKEKTEDK